MMMLGTSKGDRQVIIQAEFLYTKGRWKREQNSKVYGRSKQLHISFFVAKTFKNDSLSSLQCYNTVLLTIAIMLDTMFPRITYFTTGSLYFFFWKEGPVSS